MATKIGIVHPSELWPSSPGARRRAWVESLFDAVVSRSGRIEIVHIPQDVGIFQARCADFPGLDTIAVHVHGGMATSIPCAVDAVREAAEGARLIFFGDALTEKTAADHLAEQGHLTCRGLPNGAWVSEISRFLHADRRSPGGKVVEPILPGWDALPGGCFPDPESATTLLVRTSLGVGVPEAGCGVTAFEGPHRVRHLEMVRQELQRTAGDGIDRIEVVDPGLQNFIRGSESALLTLLESADERQHWTLPLAGLLEADVSVWRRYRTAGVDFLRAGLASASQRLCAALDAPLNPNDVSRALDGAREAGIETELVLRVGGPGETVDDRKQSVAWLRDHADSINTLVVLPYVPSPGSEMMRRPERYGVWWPSGGDREEWVDAAGNNRVSRSKHLWELVEVARALGVEILTPGSTPDPDVRRHRNRILKRYEVEGSAEEDEPETIAGVEVFDSEPEIPADEVPFRRQAGVSGPRNVEIELSAACNLRCVGCWCHSELLSSDRHAELQRSNALPTRRITELLEECAALGVREIQFSGSGEPLVNRDAEEIVGRASALGMRTTLVTNGTLLDKPRVDALATVGLDQVTVSLWAGDQKTYEATHPGAGARAFDRVNSGLRALARARRRFGRPLIKLYHVISRPNSGGVEAMVRHGLEHDADQIEFQIIDVVPDTAEDLSLSPKELDTIERSFERLQTWPEYTTHWLEKPHLLPKAPPIVWQELDDFGRFLRLANIDGFVQRKGPHLTCPRGLADESMSKLDGDVFELTYPERVCRVCSRRDRCFPDGTVGRLRIPTLKVTGVGPFLRRARAAVRDPDSAEAELVLDMPCVVGDLYSRIDYRGNVVACCKGSSAPLGNVTEESFFSVWTSPRYTTFRRNAKTLSKDDPYFAPFGCLKSCDNLGMNLHALYTADGRCGNESDAG